MVVENEDGRPARILDAKGAFWRFDDQGRIDKELRKAAWAAMEFAFESGPKPRGKVIDLRPELKRKAFQNEHQWEVTAEDLDRIAADLWPGLADAPEVTIVKGKAPRKPAVSHDAKHAVREIGHKLGDINRSLEELSEHSLKGLSYEARRLARAYPLENGPLWAAVAEERIGIARSRHDTGQDGGAGMRP